MDLSGHERFAEAARRATRPSAEPAPARPGEALVATAWAALASARAEAADIHLRTGGIVPQVLALRIEGRVAEASTRRGHWTHAFLVDEVVMVRLLPRGRDGAI